MIATCSRCGNSFDDGDDVEKAPSATDGAVCPSCLNASIKIVGVAHPTPDDFARIRAQMNARADWYKNVPHNGSADAEHNANPEVQRRIVAALDKIEAAQHLLQSACGDDLSALEGAIPIWRATGKLADAAHNLWRRLCYGANNRWKLDRDHQPKGGGA